MRGIAASRREQVSRLSGRGRRAFARHRVEQHWVSPTISFRWSFDHRRIPGPPLPVWSGSVGATARNCRAARLAITTHMYRDTSKPQALPSKRNGLPRGQGSTPPTSQSVHASIAQSNLAVHTRNGSILCGRVLQAAAPRRCGGHVAVHGRDKYLNLLACGGVVLGSQRRPMPPRMAAGGHRDHPAPQSEGVGQQRAAVHKRNGLW